MEYRRVGNSGLKVSAISLGGWTTFGDSVQDRQAVQGIVDAAIDGGVNFFDEADVYARGRSEELMGEALKRHSRDKLVVSSKVFWPMSDDPNDKGLSRKHVMQSIDGSLKRLGTDYLDLYFCHRYDPDTPLEEVVQAMSDLVQQGKVLYWGTSEWTGTQVAEAVQIARANGLRAPVVEQPQYSMLHRERVENEIIPVADRYGIGLVVWSPLGMGLLTGKYDDGMPADGRLSQGVLGKHLLTDANIEKVRRLKPIAEDLGVSRTALALAWVLRRSTVSSAIVGATKVEQVRANLEHADFRLEGEALQRVDEVLGG